MWSYAPRYGVAAVIVLCLVFWQSTNIYELGVQRLSGATFTYAGMPAKVAQLKVSGATASQSDAGNSKWSHPSEYLASDSSLENGVLVSLSRNEDLEGMLQVMGDMEKRILNRHRYPYVFLNDKPFTAEFRKLTAAATQSPVFYGQIPMEHWGPPPSMTNKEVYRALAAQYRKEVPGGKSYSYHAMCRFNSGFVWQHPLLQGIRYYWRVEPGAARTKSVGMVEYHCDMQDLFRQTRLEKKQYGFVIAFEEDVRTISKLWDHVKEFMVKYPQYIHPNNSMQFISDDNGETHNLCQFWSNFEITDMEFFRGRAYRQFFNYLDSTGGFFTARWGDAPVHSIAAALFLDRKDIKFWDDIGYTHTYLSHCPSDTAIYQANNCNCTMKKAFEQHNKHRRCLERFKALSD